MNTLNVGDNAIALDKDADVYPLPRAAHFDHEIMRLFQQVGIAEEVARHARPAPAFGGSRPWCRQTPSGSLVLLCSVAES